MEYISQGILLTEAQSRYINRVGLLIQNMHKLFHQLKELLDGLSKNLNFTGLLHVRGNFGTNELKNACVNNIRAGQVVLTVLVFDLQKVDHSAVNTVAAFSDLLNHVYNQGFEILI